MKQYFFIIILLLSLCSNAFAYSIKVYDDYGNRIGTYKKEGDVYVLYDFNDKKIENPDEYLNNPPTPKSLNQYTGYFYSENYIPIGNYGPSFYNNTIAYPRARYNYPKSWYNMTSPAIVRTRKNYNTDMYQTNRPCLDIRYPKFHNIKK